MIERNVCPVEPRFIKVRKKAKIQICISGSFYIGLGNTVLILLIARFGLASYSLKVKF